MEVEISFVTGIVRIIGVVNPLLNPTTGINLGNLAHTQSIIVEFDVKINSLPVLLIVSNTSHAKFSYKIDSNAPSITRQTYLKQLRLI